MASHDHRAVNRRDIMVAAGVTFVTFAAPAAGQEENSLATIERRHGGRLGVFALDLHTHKMLSHRADQRFKLESTFKGLLAASVLAAVDRGMERLDAIVPFGLPDLLPASPVTEAAVGRGKLTVGELCAAIMIRSDNTAANLLMARYGGPRRLTAFLRRAGDHVTRVDSYEGQSAGKPAAFDTTTPRAVVGTVRRLLLGEVLSSTARVQLEDWMAGNVVGRARLRAAFPSDWRSGDRTGTGDGICNDYAIARRPGRAPLLVSAYYAAPGMALADQEAVIRAVGQAVVEWQR